MAFCKYFARLAVGNYSKELNSSRILLRNNAFHTASCFLAVKGKPLKMPSLSPTMTEGTIVKWLKQEGDIISPGDVLCEIQTDKAVVAMDTEDEGVLAKILVSEDSRDIKVGSLIGLMVEEGEDFKDVVLPEADSVPPTSELDNSVNETLSGSPTDIKIGPAAKHLLYQYGLDSSQVPASGPRHTLSKSDVLQYIQSHNVKSKTLKDFIKTAHPRPVEEITITKPSPKVQLTASSLVKKTTSDFKDLDISNMRRTIAKRLTQSKTTIPHSYGSIICSMENIQQLRKYLKEENVKVSVNDFIIKSAAVALKRVPEVNAQWSEDGKIKQLNNIDISIAVATDSGLITPIVKNACYLGIETISSTVKELAGRARIGKLMPEEFIGGSFSISNLGMFGISDFSAVINPPQAAILAIGTSELAPKEVVVDGKKKIVPESLMTCTLSYDARVFNEDAAVRFLTVFKENMENPMNNLLDGPKVESKVAALL